MQMSKAFEQMNVSLQSNLQTVNQHIKEVQSGNHDAQVPQLEPLSVILNAIGKKLGSQIQKSLINASAFEFKSMIGSVVKTPIERKDTTLSDIMKEREQVKTDEVWGKDLKEELIRQKEAEEGKQGSAGSRRGSQLSSKSKKS